MTPLEGIEALERAIAWRIAVSVAASADHDGSTPDGERWEWKCIEADHTQPLDNIQILDEVLVCPQCPDDSYRMSLRSVQTYPRRSGSMLPHFALPEVEEMEPAVALYLVTHSPHDALRRYGREQRLLAEHHPIEARAVPGLVEGAAWVCRSTLSPFPCSEVRDLADQYGVQL